MQLKSQRTGQGFPKEDRIRKRQEYQIFKNDPLKIRGRFSIALVKKSPTNRNRLGITITRRVGNAVKRNRIKRIYRELFRRHQNSINGKWDINLIAKREARSMSFGTAEDDIKTIFKRISRV